jgi:hypothetical protein
MSVTPYLPSRTKPPKARRRRGITPVTYSKNQPINAASTQDYLPRKPLGNEARFSRDLNTSLPVKLQAMILVHRGASAITCCLVTAALAAYGWTVCIPKIWSHEYRELESLQRHERQLTETNEALKNQLARQAERSGLVQSNPGSSIFLKPTVAPATRSSLLDTAKITLPSVSTPVAY